MLAGYCRASRGYEVSMTNAGENVTPEPAYEDEEVLAPATPGAEALPLPDDEVERPSKE